MPRIVLVVSSPRFPLLFPPQTWRALDAARPVYVLDAEHPSLPALDVGEIPWEVLTPAADSGPAGRDLLLPPRNDGPLVQLVADRAARQHIEVETVYPLGEPKGSALLDLVATEARLRGPDGCPWDREQTHASLARHLVEESYELLDAIEEGDPDHLREELGDLLLQVVFHAQMAEDAGDFDVDGVARAITEKLVRRHPHVFGDGRADTPAEVMRNWETIKREEEGRSDPLAGIPSALPALQLAAKLQKRAAEGGFAWPSRTGPADKVREELEEVLAATEPEPALRRTSRRCRARYAAARAAAEAVGHDPSSLELEQWIAYWKAAKRALAEAEQA